MIHSEDYIDRLTYATEKRVNHSRPDLGEDLRQVGWESAIRAMSTYEYGRGARLSTWLIMHMRRDMVRYLEAEHKHAGWEDLHEYLDTDDVDELIDYEAQLRLESQTDIHAMLEHLPALEQDACILHFCDDLSYREIGEHMSLNKQAVYRLVTGAVRFLRRKFS